MQEGKSRFLFLYLARASKKKLPVVISSMDLLFPSKLKDLLPSRNIVFSAHSRTCPYNNDFCAKVRGQRRTERKDRESTDRKLKPDVQVLT